MEKKIFVEAHIDFEAIDDKIQRFLKAREEFGKAAYALEQAVDNNVFQLLIKGYPLNKPERPKHER